MKLEYPHIYLIECRQVVVGIIILYPYFQPEGQLYLML